MASLMMPLLMLHQMWFIPKQKRKQTIPYTERVTNVEVLERAGEKRNLTNITCCKNNTKQAMFFGHVMRRQRDQKTDEKRSRARQREKLLDHLTFWLYKHTNKWVVCGTGMVESNGCHCQQAQHPMVIELVIYSTMSVPLILKNFA